MCYIDHRGSKGTDIIKKSVKMTKKAKKPVKAKNSLSANAATCRDNLYNKKVSKASE